MKNLIRISTLASLALAATALTAQAQNAKSVGLLAGVDFASMTGDDFNDTGSKTGFVGGLYVTVPAGRALAIEPEVLYVNKGLSDNGSDLKLSHNYIEIPVLVRYNFSTEGGAYFLAGPAVGFSVSCSIHDDVDSVDCSEFAETNTTFGGVLGLGYQKGRLGLEGRYDFDFGDAFKDTDGKNAAWEILARIMLK